MRASDFGFDMSILNEINDENIFAILSNDIQINFESKFLYLSEALTLYINNFNNMSLETREFYKTTIKTEYIEYRKNAIKLLKNSHLDFDNDKELQDIIDIENSRFKIINDLVKNSKIMK